MAVLKRQSSVRSVSCQYLIEEDRKKQHGGRRRISISELPLLGSLKDTKKPGKLNFKCLDPILRKVAKKIAKHAWRGAIVSAKLLFIAPYIPLVLFFVLCDWVLKELGEYLTEEDTDSISSWSTTSTLVDLNEDIRG
ncbi:hypothetical protein PG990_009889 [Apiospora arundinis]|uniref:Uncharacterized protein n=1 Tax=Apiospora arundinis TaxID=335852 RepID=A0ABR2IVA1_9PEZI